MHSKLFHLLWSISGHDRSVKAVPNGSPLRASGRRLNPDVLSVELIGPVQRAIQLRAIPDRIMTGNTSVHPQADVRS